MPPRERKSAPAPTAAPKVKRAAKGPAARPAARAKAINAKAPPALDPGEAVAVLAARLAAELKAVDIRVLDLRDISTYLDYFVIVTGTSDRHVMAVADNITQKMKKQGHVPFGVEGHDTGLWVLIDLGPTVVHVFQPEIRKLYDLESLWVDAREVPCA